MKSITLISVTYLLTEEKLWKRLNNIYGKLVYSYATKNGYQMIRVETEKIKLTA